MTFLAIQVKGNRKARLGMAALDVNHSQRNQAFLKENWVFLVTISSLMFILPHSSTQVPWNCPEVANACGQSLWSLFCSHLAVLISSILPCWPLSPSCNSLPSASAFFFYFYLYSYSLVFLELLSDLTPRGGFSRSKVAITPGECKRCVKCISIS